MVDASKQKPDDSINSHAIKIDNLWRIYKRGSQQDVSALRGVNLRIYAGHFVALKGRSGSGKTTLINCIGGLDHPTSGAIEVFGQDISKFSEDDLTNWRRQNIGFVFQSFGLLPTLSALENVELMLRITGVGSKERHHRSLEVLNLVGLSKWADHRPYELSGGQQQRTAIARAMIHRPRLILADEPTGELDSTTARDILALFRQISDKEKVTILIASHDSLVDEYVDQTSVLKDGQIIEQS